MARYTCGSFGIRFEGIGGSWRVVEKHEKGFLLWESETYGSRAKKIFTDKDGNILINGVNSFNDFAVRAKISEYERIRDSIACDQIIKELAIKNVKKENGNTRIDSVSKKPEETSDSNSETQNQSASSSEQPAKQQRPAPRKAAGKNVHARESVLNKLHEYQSYVEATSKKAQ